MNLWTIIAAVLVGAAVLLSAYVRLTPVPAALLDKRPGPMEPGEHVKRGGFKAVVPIRGDAADMLARLDRIARATPRTVRIRKLGEAHSASYVTRTLFWGFPDVTNVWVADGNLHIHAHLVYGGSDGGVNRARVRSWLKALEALD